MPTRTRSRPTSPGSRSGSGSNGTENVWSSTSCWASRADELDLVAALFSALHGRPHDARQGPSGGGTTTVAAVATGRSALRAEDTHAALGQRLEIGVRRDALRRGVRAGRYIAAG